MNIESFRTAILNLQPIDLLAYQEVIPEFQLMANCAQSPEHHSEGNVLIHASMASNIILHLMEMEEVKNEDKVILYLATILHDIGKPSTSVFNEKKNKITAYGHDKAGAPIANEFLKKYFPEMTYPYREKVLRLIEHHMQPRLWMKDLTATVPKMRMLSLSVNTKLLYLLSQADTLGRTAKDMKTGMFLLELFKQNCQDIGIWDRPYRAPFATHLDNASYSLARWNILMHEAPEDNDTYDAARELMGKPIPHFQLLILVGAPGSGKSTYCKQMLEKYPNLKIISMDERRKEFTGDINDQSRNQEVFSWQEKELRKAMEARQSVILDSTNPNIKNRKHLWDIGREKGALCSAVYFDLSLDLLLQRNANREKKVPNDIVKRIYNSQQSVRSYEADQIIIIDK